MQFKANTLDFLYNHPAYRKLNIYSGTCLLEIYTLYLLPEDIDLDKSNGIDLNDLEGDIQIFFRTNIGYPEVTAKTQLEEWGIRRTTLKFPVLYTLDLTPYSNEVLHLKVDVSQHKQIPVIQKTPTLTYGRSFVAAHFSLEILMVGKMLVCLERNFQKGSTGAEIKGRKFYDLLWFMQQKIKPLEEKLAKDGKQSSATQSAMELLGERVVRLKTTELVEDLLLLFEQRSFIEAWLEGIKDNFICYQKNYF